MIVSLGIIVVATLLVGVVGTGFAVLLGFVIVASFGSYQAASG